MKRATRRGIVTVWTIITLFKVAIGSFLLGNFFDNNPNMFVLFWGVCLISVCLIIAMALMEIRSVRKEFKQRQDDLDSQLTKYIVEAREKKGEAQN